MQYLFICISDEELLNVSNSIRNNNASGNDVVPTKVLKKVINSALNPLVYLLHVF